MSLQANAYNARVQGDLWNPAKNGVLWRGATAEANTKVSDWNLRNKYSKEFDDKFRTGLRVAFDSNRYRLKYLNHRTDGKAPWFFEFLDEFKAIIPMSGSISFGD